MGAVGSQLLKDCDGDVGTTELIMSLMKLDPGFNREKPLPGEGPDLKLVKVNDSQSF